MKFRTRTLTSTYARPRPLPKKERPRCGAKTRAGGTCQAPAVWDDRRNKPRNGRCRMHGGLSTGPRTPEGVERIREALRNRKRPANLNNPNITPGQPEQPGQPAITPPQAVASGAMTSTYQDILSSSPYAMFDDDGWPE